MSSSLLRVLALFFLGATLACNAAAAWDVSIPDPVLDAPLAATKGEQTAVLAGGCFWGVEAVFEHVNGVTGVTSGYSGGSDGAADYESVSAGNTGHAESVRITYDPSQVTYGRLLKVFFSVAHDPTQLNRQGPDVGKHSFHEAEAYHQDYAARHPDQPYIVIHDLPKVENLRKLLPELYAVK